jgi:hypothetical protein
VSIIDINPDLAGAISVLRADGTLMRRWWRREGEEQ